MYSFMRLSNIPNLLPTSYIGLPGCGRVWLGLHDEDFIILHSVLSLALLNICTIIYSDIYFIRYIIIYLTVWV